MRRIFLVLLVGVVLVLPSLVLAAPTAPATSTGLVPCAGPECQVCHVIELGQRIINFLVGIASFLAVALFAYAGWLMLSAAGDTGQVTKAHGIFTNVVVGVVIVLAGWLIVDTVMKWTFQPTSDVPTEKGSELYEEAKEKWKFGPWNEIKCAILPGYVPSVPGGPSLVVVPGSAGGSPYTTSQLQAKIAGTQPYTAQLAQACTTQGLQNCTLARAVMAIESHGDKNAISPVGAVGLMQVMPGTAATLDTSLQGRSDAEITQRLQDPTYNITLGVKELARLEKKYGGDATLMVAAYNGGDKANVCGSDCQRVCGGGTAWQCAGIVPNGYGATRKYVPDVLNAAKLIST